VRWLGGPWTGPGSHPGDRAPARGVDVKPLPRRGPGSPGTPFPGPGDQGPRPRSGRPPGSRIPDPGDRWEPSRPGAGETPPGAPGAPAPRPQGLLLHQPLAAGPCGPSGTPGAGEVAPGPCPGPLRDWEASRRPKPPFFPTPAKTGYRAPPRGVDVKPPLRGVPGPEFQPPFKENARFWAFGRILAR